MTMAPTSWVVPSLKVARNSGNLPLGGNERGPQPDLDVSVGPHVGLELVGELLPVVEPVVVEERERPRQAGGPSPQLRCLL